MGCASSKGRCESLTQAAGKSCRSAALERGKNTSITPPESPDVRGGNKATEKRSESGAIMHGEAVQASGLN